MPLVLALSAYAALVAVLSWSQAGYCNPDFVAYATIGHMVWTEPAASVAGRRTGVCGTPPSTIAVGAAARGSRVPWDSGPGPPHNQGDGATEVVGWCICPGAGSERVGRRRGPRSLEVRHRARPPARATLRAAIQEAY